MSATLQGLNFGCTQFKEVRGSFSDTKRLGLLDIYTPLKKEYDTFVAWLAEAA